MSDLKRYEPRVMNNSGDVDMEIYLDGEWCKYADVADLSLRIAVAVKMADYLKGKDPSSVEVILGINQLLVIQQILTMPISSLHLWLEQNPQYGDV